MLDLKNAYENIRIIPEHVPQTTVTTPDGNMVRNVVQQGDCNAPATHQALMNHIFSPYIGQFMDICMDPTKVDSVLNWKVPTNHDLLRGFIGLVSYLADDIPNI